MRTSKHESPEQPAAGFFTTLQPWVVAAGLCIVCAVVTGATGTWDSTPTRVAVERDAPCDDTIDADHPERAAACAEHVASTSRAAALAEAH